jgi:hypothetical protein
MATIESTRSIDHLRAAQCRGIRCLGRTSQPQLQRFVFSFAGGSEESYDFAALRRLTWWHALPAEEVVWVRGTLEHSARVAAEQASEVRV